MKLFRACFALLPLIFVSCAVDPVSEDDPFLQRELDQETSFVSENGFSYWDDKPEAGPLRVSIDLSEQTAYFYRGDVQVGKSRVATGKPGHSTPTGSFSITEKVADKRSNLYGKIYDANGTLVVADADKREDSVPTGGRYVGAAMPYWMRLTDYGIGMHAGPIPNPGSPASHGCIRMPRDMVRILFDASNIGTKVRIKR